MAVIKVNILNTQALQTLLTRLPCIFRVSIDHEITILHHNSELGGQEDVVPLAGSLEPFANQVFTICIDVCGVPECLAHFVRFVEDLEAVAIRLGLAVETRKARGAETKSGDLGTLKIWVSASRVETKFKVR